jgi:hypothetical protein
MESPHDASTRRRVLVATMRGMIEGDLPVGPQLRTLDYLNRSTTRFVPLCTARPLSSRASLEGKIVHVNIESILWVAEIETMPRAARAAVKPQLNRAAVRICFPDCEILGFLHVPPHGDPFARLNQDRSSFLAVTSASIIGSDTERAAPFVAVNSRQAFTLEMIADDDAVEESSSVFEEAGSCLARREAA